MLQKIDCPSYKNITMKINGKNEQVSIVPAEQFHTLMTLVLANNAEIERMEKYVDELSGTIPDEVDGQELYERVLRDLRKIGLT